MELEVVDDFEPARVRRESPRSKIREILRNMVEGQAVCIPSEFMSTANLRGLVSQHAKHHDVIMSVHKDLSGEREGAWVHHKGSR